MSEKEGKKKVEKKENKPEQFKVIAPKRGFVTGTNIPRQRKKVAIVGFAPSSMTDVRHLFGDPEFEIWSINQLYMAFPAIVEHTTRWFQMHAKHSYNEAIRDHSHHQWLANQKRFPIYMKDREPDVPMSVPFPKDEIINMFGRYFTNSISWELALAIYEGFESIHVYGVDMAQDEEYREQRPSVEYFLGWAKGAGINLYIPEKSDLLKTTWLYPFEDDSPMRMKLESRRKELRGQVDNLAGQEQQIHDQRMQFLGALDNMNYIRKTWSDSVRDQYGAAPIMNR